MNNYQVNVNLTFSNIDRHLRQLDKQTKELGKQTGFSQIVKQSEQIRNNLLGIGPRLHKELNNALNQAKLQISRANILQGLGADLPTVNRRANLAQPYIDAANSAIRLNRTTRDLYHNLGRATASAKQLNAVYHGAADATSRMFNNMFSPMPMLRSMGQGIKNVGTMLGGYYQQAKRTYQANMQMNRSFYDGSSAINAWWNHFGRIAIGFTIAYRAMNAFEALLGKLTSTLKGAIVEAGEFATLQGKLAMFAVMASKNTLDFDEAYEKAAGSIQELAKASVTSMSSIQELSVAMDELAQAGVFVKPGQMKEFTAFVDFTSLVAQTTGDNVRQIRSEINALMEGQLRANNTLIRMMLKFGILDAKMVKDLKQMKNRSEAFELIIKKISLVWDKFLDKALRSDPALAFGVWEKSIKRTLMAVIAMYSGAKGEINIFAATIKKHIDDWNKSFSGDITGNKTAKQFAVLFDLINRGLEIALTSFEKMLKFVAQAATVIYNLREPIITIAKAWLMWETVMVSGKIFTGVATKIWNLHMALAATEKTLPVLAKRFALTFGILIGATLYAASAFEVFFNKSSMMEKPVTSLVDGIIKLIEKLGVLKHALLGAGLGFMTFGSYGAIAGAIIGGTIDLMPDLYDKADEVERKGLEMEKADFERQARWKRITQDYANAQIARIDARLAELSGKTKKSFEEEVFKKMTEHVASAFDMMLEKLAPLKDKLGKLWDELSDPKNINLKGFEGSLEGFDLGAQKTTKSLEDLDKEIGSISSNMYERFVKAVNDGKVALANLYADPAKMELLYKQSDKRRQKALIEEALVYARSSNDVNKYRSQLATVNAELEEISENLAKIDYKKQLAPAVAITKRLEDELAMLKTTMVEGTPEYIAALAEIKTRYADAFADVTITPEDFKQMDSFTKYREHMKEMKEATGGWKEGMRQAFDELRKVSVIDQVKGFVVGAFDSMENAIVSFTSKGKSAFTDMVESMINDLLRLIVRMQVIQPIAQLLNTTFFAQTSPMISQGAFWESGATGSLSYAKGGWINEHVVGLGLSSGKRYDIGEGGESEKITPASQMGEHKTEVNIYGAPAGTQVKESSEGGIKRIDVYIDELVASKLAGGSKSANVLRRVYGLSPALAGR